MQFRSIPICSEKTYIHITFNNLTNIPVVLRLQMMCRKFVFVENLTHFINDSFTQWQIVDFEQAENEIAGLTLGFRPGNERRRHKVTPSLIGWAQT